MNVLCNGYEYELEPPVTIESINEIAVDNGISHFSVIDVGTGKMLSGGDFPYSGNGPLKIQKGNAAAFEVDIQEKSFDSSRFKEITAFYESEVLKTKPDVKLSKIEYDSSIVIAFQFIEFDTVDKKDLEVSYISAENNIVVKLNKDDPYTIKYNYRSLMKKYNCDPEKFDIFYNDKVLLIVIPKQIKDEFTKHVLKVGDTSKK